MNQTPNIEELKTEFTKWHTAETTFAYGIPDDETIADWWIEKLHHQLQKVREEERGKAIELMKIQIATGVAPSCEFILKSIISSLDHSELDQPNNK